MKDTDANGKKSPITTEADDAPPTNECSHCGAHYQTERLARLCCGGDR